MAVWCGVGGQFGGELSEGLTSETVLRRGV